MTAQLAQMAAAGKNFILLAHLLEMAWLEAEELRWCDLIAPPRCSYESRVFSPFFLLTYSYRAGCRFVFVGTLLCD